MRDPEFFKFGFDLAMFHQNLLVHCKK